ncbi:HAMP domain-containing sensor histidine kinase [Methylobacterium sp. Leaf108]|uniref:sensor histidine kinase n=1 Tax=Methylobacterium sp. Leaf108 TaxID=1736256 RepID=UPI0009E71821|nr:HAMP domain-containing sensor histidine kinase [Methylobacterium sp. Leaf108]
MRSPGATPSSGRKGPPHVRLGSLRRRLLTAALVLVVAALVVAGIAIGLILHRFVRGQLDSRLDSQIVAIATGLEAGPNGLATAPGLDGPPFDRRRSGWYWQVRRDGTVLRSGTLEGRDLDVPAGPRRPRDHDGPHPADGVDPWGRPVILRVLTLPPGAGAGPTVIAAAAPAAALNGPLREALGALALTLGVLGLCLMAGVVAQVHLGLRPLERLRRDLAQVREGRRARIPAAQPAEIKPLVAEVNALLDQGEANLERARTHVANLAHGLKTPLATLSMALASEGRDTDGRLSALVSAMDGQIRHHLRRARAAALGEAARTRLELAGPVADLRTTFVRLYAEKGVAIALDLPAGLGVACDGQDLDEMLGNLVDNACRWCRTRVRIAAAARGAGIVIAVEDDGPGLDAQAAAEALRRGRRLDESLPGHGFGLSITTELADLYGGGLALGRAGLGGLRAELTLPA